MRKGVGGAWYARELIGRANESCPRDVIFHRSRGWHERESNRNEITLNAKIFIYRLLCPRKQRGGADLPLANSLSRNFIRSEFQPNRS
ncbi:hypothetical protein CEXT_49801 [Caerostris extrusa]|uniref:Uncharacterized protein n=1 Tax=Caerostris extrusa TaxID=172846 RepID=A0AAV4NEP5_CAEEX|nr:hypothetical protein CEXT_49801 [Caerostris extrusa]